MDDAVVFSRRGIMASLATATLATGRVLPQSLKDDRPAPSSEPRRLVDPELLPYLDGWSPPAISTATLPKLRKQSEGAVEWLPSPLAYRQTIPGLPGKPPVSVILIYPTEVHGYRPAFLHLHGGGFIMGNADMAVRRVQDVVKRHQCFALLVDYRLAPEHPFPAAIEDALARSCG